ncbi:MAG TPA: iron-containing redox enzyme family protein [Pseudomonadaceae bacterium]|nr:iron-containing redox enzyme family protein [Pseudomonadaceae bacterium]
MAWPQRSMRTFRAICCHCQKCCGIPTIEQRRAIETISIRGKLADGDATSVAAHTRYIFSARWHPPNWWTVPGCSVFCNAGRIRIYLEELGCGIAAQNHVVLYRQLLARYGCEQWQDCPDEAFTQGVVQLALAHNADEFLPELLGYNLGHL